MLTFLAAAAVLAAIAVVGALQLEVPLHRDQALWAWYASQMHDGKLLYVDLWDVKQPGAYLFYFAGGAMFGFNERGIHLLELAWMLALAVAVMAAMRTELRHRWLACVAPAAVLLPYYALAHMTRLTQTEALAWLPLFLAAWCLAVSAERTAKGRLPAGMLLALLGGLAAGGATLFKHLFAPIPVGCLLIASVWLFRRADAAGLRRVLVGLWLPFAVGVIVVWAGVSAVLLAMGAFDAFFESNFLYPLNAMGLLPSAPLSRLLFTFVYLGMALAPWLLLLLVGLPLLRRSRHGLLVQMLIGWVGFGLLVLLVQKNAWWTYQGQILYLPLGLLAIVAVDLGLEWLTGPSGARPAARATLAPLLAFVLLGAIIAGYAYPAGDRAYQIYKAAVVDKVGIEGFRRRLNAEYAAGAAAADFLADKPGSAPIYVFGNPLIHLRSGRPQASAVHGQSAEYLLPTHWQRLSQDLTTRPPEFIYIETDSADSVERHSPAIAAMLVSRYQVVRADQDGRWYALRDGG